MQSKHLLAERFTAIRWLNKDSDKLLADSRYPTYRIPNYTLHPNGSLEVTNVQLDDTGDYICEVTIGSRVIRQISSIEVQGKLANVNVKCIIN